jgi:hypothetical protein
MTLETARQMIGNRDTTFQDRIKAAAVISSARESSFDELLTCLQYPGLPAEFAAMALYQRTGRPVPEDARSFSADLADWRTYLSTHSPATNIQPTRVVA